MNQEDQKGSNKIKKRQISSSMGKIASNCINEIQIGSKSINRLNTGMSLGCSPVGIGLTEHPNTGGAKAPPAPPLTTALK